MIKTRQEARSKQQLAATAMLLCSFMGRSFGYSTAIAGGLAAANTPNAFSKVSAATFHSNGHANGQGKFSSLTGSTSSSTSSFLDADDSRRQLFQTVASLRGGSPTMSLPGFDAAAAAVAAIPAAGWAGGPALFAQGVLLSLVTSIDGFRIREHFVSYGYGFSVALQAVGAAWLFRDGLHTLSVLHAAGLVAYGLRLVLFCRWRDSLTCFQTRKKRAIEPKKNNGRPYAFWGICSTLYAFLALPTVYALRRLPAADGFVGVSQAGLATMAVGLIIESVADHEKSKFKKKERDSFCNNGLYRISRHPNYFGEVVFWGGVWLAAIPAYTIW